MVFSLRLRCRSRLKAAVVGDTEGKYRRFHGI